MKNASVYPTALDVMPVPRLVEFGLPSATCWLNYPGDQTKLIGKWVGPNCLGEYMTIVEVVFDAESNKSRVGLAIGAYHVEDAK